MLLNCFYICLWITIICRLSKGSVYNVVVVEYGPNLNINLTANERLAINLGNYIKIIEDTSTNINQTLDLIIFPESTLMYLDKFLETAAQIPSSSNVILCDTTEKDYAEFLKELSCAAIQYKTTIIINFTEKVPCHIEENDTRCTEEVYYNTNVAIASNGSVIARYRKWNLFGENRKSRPKTLDLSVIEIQNTTFGMMTCFDIQFGVPIFNLTRQKKVKNIIFPLNWISELPYLTALQVQQMWAQEFDVVLLAAGSSAPDVGAGGSGIFLGSRGTLESDILAKPGTKVILQTVSTDLQNQSNYIKEDTDDSIDTLASSMDEFYMLVDPSIKDHNSIILNITQENTETRICHGDEKNNLCCDFNISLSIDQNKMDEDSTYYTYHLVAFNGIRTYSGLYYGGIETCGLVACLNSSVASCGQRFKNYSNIIWPVTFKSISITGLFTPSELRVQFATTLLTSIRPLPLHAISWDNEAINSTILRRLTLKKSQTRLLTFGIFGRDFERDWDPIDRNISNNSSNIELNLVYSFILIIFIFACSKYSIHNKFV